jgi:hypothetical protein
MERSGMKDLVEKANPSLVMERSGMKDLVTSGLR